MSDFRTGPLPSYERPPVNEVGIGIGFAPLRCWNSVAPGEFFRRVQADYPIVEDKPPLLPLKAELNPAYPGEFTDLPPVRRTWFVSDDGASLIQTQEDRLHFNWRQFRPNQEYPRHGQVLACFESVLRKLIAHAAEHGETLAVHSGEVTYVNHIPRGELWKEWHDLGGIFSGWNPIPNGIENPAALNCSVSFVGSSLSEATVIPGHNLTVELKSGQRMTDQLPVLVFQLTDRGRLESMSEVAIREWVGDARANIVKGFTSLTTSTAHRFWGRTQ